MTRCLITGACGFVGSTLALAFAESFDRAKLRLTGIDNFSRPGSWTNRDRLKQKGIEILHGDLRLASDLESLGPFDWVINAAANPSVLAGVDGKTNSRQLIEHNLLATVHLLEACKRWNAGFVLLSTSRVYSIPPLANLPVRVEDQAFRVDSSKPLPVGICEAGISETFSTSAPVSLYGATKLASEQLALEYGFTFDLPVWINRCGVLAGAGQFGRPDQGIFAYWLHSWRERKPLKYIGFDGCGHQVRDVLHPRDLVPLLWRQMQTRPDGHHPQVVNVSGGAISAHSLAQLTRWCQSRYGDHEVATDSRPRPFDLPWVVLNSDLARRTWGWTPETTPEAILEEIAMFADEHPQWIQQSL